MELNTARSLKATAEVMDDLAAEDIRAGGNGSDDLTTEGLGHPAWVTYLRGERLGERLGTASELDVASEAGDGDDGEADDGEAGGRSGLAAADDYFARDPGSAIGQFGKFAYVGDPERVVNTADYSAAEAVELLASDGLLPMGEDLAGFADVRDILDGTAELLAGVTSPPAELCSRLRRAGYDDVGGGEAGGDVWVPVATGHGISAGMLVDASGGVRPAARYAEAAEQPSFDAASPEATPSPAEDDLAGAVVSGGGAMGLGEALRRGGAEAAYALADRGALRGLADRDGGEPVLALPDADGAAIRGAFARSRIEARGLAEAAGHLRAEEVREAVISRVRDSGGARSERGLTDALCTRFSREEIMEAVQVAVTDGDLARKRSAGERSRRKAPSAQRAHSRTYGGGKGRLFGKHEGTFAFSGHNLSGSKARAKKGPVTLLAVPTASTEDLSRAARVARECALADRPALDPETHPWIRPGWAPMQGCLLDAGAAHYSEREGWGTYQGSDDGGFLPDREVGAVRLAPESARVRLPGEHLPSDEELRAMPPEERAAAVRAHNEYLSARSAALRSELSPGFVSRVQAESEHEKLAHRYFFWRFFRPRKAALDLSAIWRSKLSEPGSRSLLALLTCGGEAALPVLVANVLGVRARARRAIAATAPALTKSELRRLAARAEAIREECVTHRRSGGRQKPTPASELTRQATARFERRKRWRLSLSVLIHKAVRAQGAERIAIATAQAVHLQNLAAEAAEAGSPDGGLARRILHLLQRDGKAPRSRFLPLAEADDATMETAVEALVAGGEVHRRFHRPTRRVFLQATGEFDRRAHGLAILAILADPANGIAVPGGTKLASNVAAFRRQAEAQVEAGGQRSPEQPEAERAAVALGSAA